MKRIYQQGFTLVELLVVIAVLGVLATVLVVSLNPAEQIARGRDSGRASSVAQLGHAMQAYITAKQTSSYPTGSATWQTDLKNAAEINAIITVTATTTPCNINAQGNICYAISGTGTDAVIWTLTESLNQKVRAGGSCASAPADNFAAFAWIASQGRTGVTCLGTTATTQPAFTATLN